MAGLFIAKRGIINIYRASPRNFNNNILQSSSRCFAAQGNDGGGESSGSMNEAMGTSTDANAPDVSVSFAADTAKEGLKRAMDLAKEEESGKAATEGSATVAGGEDESEENVTVGEIGGTVKGQNLGLGRAGNKYSLLALYS